MPTERCPNCMGAQKLQCTNGLCRGGYVTENGQTRLCPTCNANSVVTCSRCGGSGFINKTDDYQSPRSNPLGDLNFTPTTSGGSSGSAYHITAGFPRRTYDIPQEHMPTNCVECRRLVPIGERDLFFVPTDKDENTWSDLGSDQMWCRYQSSIQTLEKKGAYSQTNCRARRCGHRACLVFEKQINSS
jgi:hypothetical protein